jgi:magnesium-transporting ATPase (P-type)
MSDQALATMAQTSNLFCRVNPVQKDRVIRALKSRGHVVGYLGDGMNDAPSLHSADVGISVDSAVDAGKANRRAAKPCELRASTATRSPMCTPTDIRPAAKRVTPSLNSA